jgi:hypothetical protein
MRDGRTRHIEVAIEVGLQRAVEVLIRQVKYVGCVLLKGGIADEDVELP